jgi:NhaA family Na+:H+ antiporter
MSTSSPRRVVRAFQEFTRLEAAGGILLLLCAAAALIWANSPATDLYSRLWHTVITVGVGDFIIAKDLLHWVNDGLMAVFFFVVGLEIKREVLVGELASPKKAALPAVAAVGGMIVPAAIYLAFNLGGPAARGWGIPMATDIAFALGVLALLGDRVPLSLKVFLTALAIVDDLGAVTVIALFYTAELSWVALGVAGGAFLLMMVCNGARVRHPAVYGALGVVMWAAFLQSGVHATVAGVLGAMTIPVSAKINTGLFRSRSRELLDRFETLDVDPETHDMTGEQQEAIYALSSLVEHVETPLHRLEHALHPWVIFFIMPVFALANAGIVFAAGTEQALTHSITIGTVLGLVVGKFLGVTGFAWIAITAGIAERPRDMTWLHLAGAAVLAGIGFTMALFISALAFDDGMFLTYAKVGVLAASVVSGIAGSLVLLSAGRRTVGP